MTDAQSLVLSMLGLILLIDVSFGQDSRQFWKNWGMLLKNPSLGTARTLASGQVSLTVFWLIGAAMLLGIAYYWPRIALAIAGLLLLTVLFARSDPIILWTKDLTTWLSLHTPNPVPQGEPGPNVPDTAEPGPGPSVTGG